MFWEAIAAGAIGAGLLWFVLAPILWPRQPKPRAIEPAEPEETLRGAALAALREIEFDRETGKLSDTDYASLKASYTAQALAALRADAQAEPGTPADLEALIAGRVRMLTGVAAPACRTCGPRPEPDAAFCSECGRRLDTGHACTGCGSALPPDSSYCEACGARVAA